MRDNSGQMYMRNRYYDPASGRFTQEDPIGLAGGMNAYGFAGGDPVSDDDPFGLCPRYDAKRDRCPGRLKSAEYYRIEAMARAYMSAELGGRILRMLERGNIHRVQHTAWDREAEPWGHGVNVADKFFEDKDGVNEADRAWILGHEVGHIVQWSVGMLIKETGNANIRPNWRRLGRLMMLENIDADPQGKEYQDDANAYACFNVLVTALNNRRGHCEP